MYADNTTIYLNLNDFPVINKEIEINSELEKMNTWLKLNNLAINVYSGEVISVKKIVPAIVEIALEQFSRLFC